MPAGSLSARAPEQTDTTQADSRPAGDSCLQAGPDDKPTADRATTSPCLRTSRSPGCRAALPQPETANLKAIGLKGVQAAWSGGSAPACPLLLKAMGLQGAQTASVRRSRHSPEHWQNPTEQ